MAAAVEGAKNSPKLPPLYTHKYAPLYSALPPFSLAVPDWKTTKKFENVTVA